MLPLEPPPNAYTRVINAVGYVLVAAMVMIALWLYLSPAAIAGFLIYALACKLGVRLRRRRTLSQRAKATTVICVFVIATLIFAALGIRIGRLVEHDHRLEGMFTRVTDVLDNLRESLLAVVVGYVPQPVTKLHVQLVWMIKEHGHQVPALDISGLRTSALILVGPILGAMVVWSETSDSEHHKPLAAALVSRLSRLIGTFEAVVFAQMRISTLNTTLTAVYLLDALPLLGQYVPYSESLTLLTFVAGLIPVADNLVPNTATVVMSVTASLELAVTSLIFLVTVYKLEYFVNARIIGNHVDMRAQKLVLALIIMEALSGAGGVIVTPVLCAYMRRELADAELVS